MDEGCPRGSVIYLDWQCFQEYCFVRHSFMSVLAFGIDDGKLQVDCNGFECRQ